METVRSQDGTAIAYERGGHGPGLVLVGGALSNRSAARGLAAAIPGARHTTLAGQNHGPANDVLVPALAEFLGV